MAVVGDRITSPEINWQRIDDTDTNIIYSGSTWTSSSTNSKYYNSTLHYCHTGGGIITLYFYGTSFRLIGKMSSLYTSLNKISIDDVTETFNCYDSSIVDTDTLATTRLLYEKKDLKKSIHKVEIKTVAQSGRTYCMIFDCIDIDDDGRMCTEDEYELQEAKKKLFPVRVADDTVTTEENVANYTATLTNGERQLLLLNNGNMYLSDGKGSHVKMGSGNNCFIKASYFGDPTV